MDSSLAMVGEGLGVETAQRGVHGFQRLIRIGVLDGQLVLELRAFGPNVDRRCAAFLLQFMNHRADGRGHTGQFLQGFHFGEDLVTVQDHVPGKKDQPQDRQQQGEQDARPDFHIGKHGTSLFSADETAI